MNNKTESKAMGNEFQGELIDRYWNYIEKKSKVNAARNRLEELDDSQFAVSQLEKNSICRIIDSYAVLENSIEEEVLLLLGDAAKGRVFELCLIALREMSRKRTIFCDYEFTEELRAAMGLMLKDEDRGEKF